MASVNVLKLAIISQKYLKKSSSTGTKKITYIPHTHIVDSPITRIYALAKLDATTPEQVLAKAKDVKKLEEVIQHQRDLETLSLIEEENLGPDAALFIQAMQEEKFQEQMRKKKQKSTLPLEAMDATKKLKTAASRGAVAKKEKSWKDYFKIQEFSKWFSFSVGYSTSVNNLSEQNYSREALKLSASMSPIKYFFFGTTFMFDINGYKNQYYQPDFSYSFGYFDWHPDTWGFSYSNYANNKFAPEEGADQFNFNQGTWEVNYKTKIKEANVKGALKYIPSANDTKFNLSANKKFFNKVFLTGTWDHYFKYNQERLTLTAKSFLYKKFFVMGSVYLYSDLDKQTSLEPDYAYSFGWYDTRPFHMTMTYSNYYTPTRWPWRDEKGPSFEDGSLTISFNVKF